MCQCSEQDRHDYGPCGEDCGGSSDARRMTRDEARAYWVKSGLTYDVLTKDSVERLRELIDVRMRDRYMRGTFRAGKVRVPAPGGDAADIRCTAWYFKGSAARQAITFEKGGFIGFAGWADDTNIQPILGGFCSWVDEMASAKTEIAA